jgi:hypothetical protein
MQPSVDEKIYALSCELREATYSDVDHRDVMRQVAKKLEAIARDIQFDHWTAMQESSEWECSQGTIHYIEDTCHCEAYRESL